LKESVCGYFNKVVRGEVARSNNRVDGWCYESPNVALEAMELRQGRSRRREVVNKSDEVDARESKRRLGSLIVLFLFRYCK
jgi:hypothetical protein